MPLAIDASTPTYIGVATKPWTTASFTPPLNSLLVVVVNDDWLQFAPPTLTITSTGLTFTQQIHAGGTVGTCGGVAIYTCQVGASGGTARTVSVTTNTTSASGDSGGVKVYVVTGQDSTTPVDVTGSGSSSTNNISPTVLTTGVAGCWVFGGGTEWNTLGVPTSTDVAEGLNPANLSMMCVRKSTATAVAGAVTLNFDAAGTTPPIWTWAAISIRPAATGVTGTVAGTLPAFTGTAASTVRVTGTVVGTLPALTGSVSATVRVSATVVGVLPSFTGTAAATVRASATVVGVLPAFTGALAATVTTATGVTGTVVGTLPAFTGTAAATVRVSAAVVGVLPAFTGAASATVRASATVVGVLPAITGALTGSSGTTTYLDDVLESIPGLTNYYPLAVDARDVVGARHGTIDGVTFTGGRAVFNGSASINLGDSATFSVATTGGLSILIFLTIDNWVGAGATEYVHWAGKGTPGGHEWAFRHYVQGGDGEAPVRTGRLSFYHFNPGIPAAGQGAGSYYQDPTFPTNERVVVATCDTVDINLAVDGVIRDTDALSDYSIVPQNTTTPAMLGTRGDDTGFLVGKIRRVAFYSRVLSATEITAIYNARTYADDPGTVAPLGADLTVTVGATRLMPAVGPTRGAVTQAGPTRAGIAAADTRAGMITGATRRDRGR